MNYFSDTERVCKTANVHLAQNICRFDQIVNWPGAFIGAGCVLSLVCLKKSCSNQKATRVEKRLHRTFEKSRIILIAEMLSSHPESGLRVCNAESPCPTDLRSQS